MSLNSRLLAIQINGQGKAFCRQRIPEPGCAKKETFGKDILITSRNGDRKIRKSIRIIVDLYENKEEKPVQPVKMNIYERPKGSKEAASLGTIVLNTRFCNLSRIYK